MAILIASSKGIFVKRDLISKLALTYLLLSLNLEISVAKVKESRTVNWFEVIGSKIGTRNLAIL